GTADSNSFPTTPGAFRTSIAAGAANVFVTKLNPGGNAVDYSTFLGGTGTADAGTGIAVDGTGDAYVTGATNATDFPASPGAYQGTRSSSGQNGFVTELNAAGSGLVYSTYLSGTLPSHGDAIAVDGTGSAYVTGFTLGGGFPTTSGAFQTSFQGFGDAFVTK